MNIKQTRRAFIKNYLIFLVAIFLFISFQNIFLRIAALLISIFSLLEAEIKIKYKSYFVDEAEIKIIEGIFKKRIKKFSFTDIKSFNIEKNFLGRILKFGNVNVYTSTEMYRIENIAESEQLFKIISDKVSSNG